MRDIDLIFRIQRLERAIFFIANNSGFQYPQMMALFDIMGVTAPHPDTALGTDRPAEAAPDQT